MILTVTPNSALDRVIFLRDFVWGHTIRADGALWSPGGKAIDASWVLAELGQECLATGFLAGESGAFLQRMLEGHGVRTDFVWANGETRTNYVLIDRAQGVQSTVTVSGLQVGTEHVAALDAKVEQWLGQAKVLVLGGGVPAGMDPGWYGPWIRRARARGLPVLLDASGETLARSAPAGPTVLKPNLDELAALVGGGGSAPAAVHPPAEGRDASRTAPADTRGWALGAARELLDWGIELVLATLGAEGALAVTRERAYYLPPLPVEPVNCAGAGDAMIAALATAYAQGWPLEQGLRLAVAAATAVVITPGTAECHRADVERFLPQVRLEQIPDA